MAHNADSGGWCGCCGNLKRGTDWWCARCRQHVATEGHLWDRTYFAQTGQPCPFDVMKASPNASSETEHE